MTMLNVISLDGDFRDAEWRAQMLRAIAEQWDTTIFRYDQHNPHDIDAATVVNGLITASAEYADPALTRDDIHLYMTDLRDATNALARYEAGDGWDGDEDPERACYTDQTVLSLLNQDIDDALWPLLSGLTPGAVCFWCTRHKHHPAHWGAREAGSSLCTECKALGR